MISVGIFGPGRAGTGLGLAFVRQGMSVRIHGRHPGNVPDSLEFSWGGIPEWIEQVDVLLLAVPDDAVEEVARSLAAAAAVCERHVVLHLSGVMDVTALNPLRSTGAALGSLHPLQALSDPMNAPERLDGAVAGVEGDARAVEAAEELALAIGLKPVRIATSSKRLYHAAAVFASNYLVTVVAVARRLFEESGMSRDRARDALRPLVSGTIENVLMTDPATALTGPISRGDVATVRMHLATLSREDARLYRSLGRATLEISRLEGEQRAAMERELGMGGGAGHVDCA